MVVDAVREEKRFSPKATRHLIPARPLNVNVPISLLREKMSLDDVSLMPQAKHTVRSGARHIHGKRISEQLCINDRPRSRSAKEPVGKWKTMKAPFP